MNQKVGAFRLFLERLFTRLGLGMRAKLITLFVIIKVVPLVLLAIVAWRQSWNLGEELKLRTEEITMKAYQALSKTGEIAVGDAVKALDARATEDIERMSTDAAQRVADFLYSRDEDIRLAATLPLNEESYRNFVNQLHRRVLVPGSWTLAPDGKSWKPQEEPAPMQEVASSLEENRHFNYRAPDQFTYEEKPLYYEISFVDLDGHERFKVTTSDFMDPSLKDVSNRRNTFLHAETYFQELKKLKPGEIYVSDVIGEYVGSKVIGPYTPEKAAAAGVAFEPEKSAYAGKENPVGRQFQGIVRWATPVLQNGEIAGYVTLALDHTHIMEFTAHLIPTTTRYTELPDASGGNYAFIWDHNGRNIAHPRHFSIAGYDAETGDPQVPWLEDRIYDEWQASGKTYAEFIQDVPTFMEQSNSKKPAAELTRQGLIGLDCRYLNFAPQCTGWFDLTRQGGSGSFLIFWSKLWKLNTAATIPYYTGQYAESPRGFGFVAIGAGVADFHKPATETETVIGSLVDSTDNELRRISAETYHAISKNLLQTAVGLSVSTGIMAVIVVLIAIWMASSFTGSITRLINGISRFRSGERHFRFNAPIKDEIGALADSFDDMADSLTADVKGTLVITDLERKILYANDTTLQKVSKTLPEVLGRHYAEISVFQPDSPYDPIAALLAGRETEIYHNEHLNRDIKGTADYLRDTKGDACGYIITSNDVTDMVLEQRKIEEQRSLLDTIFSSSPDIIWYKDAEGKYLAGNPRFLALVGKPAHEVIGYTADEVFPPFLARYAHEGDQEAIERAAPAYNEQEFVFISDGHTEVVDVVRRPVYSPKTGAFMGLLGVARDVSRRVTVEKELRDTQMELKKAAVEANAANASKSEFLARMSHEIRTPMNAIIGMTNITKRKLEDMGPGTEEIAVHVRQIETSSKHLLGLLNDILDISKIEAGKIELSHESFDLQKLISGVTGIIRPRCVEKNITFIVQAEGITAERFISDPLRLRQVLINLLGNAVKFTPECGTVTFRIDQKERSQGKALLEFTVADTGIGLSDQVMRRLFMPFEQGGGQITRQYGGTGLGLSISRSIVRLLGGDILVSSAEGRGSEFFFSIQLTEDATPIAQTVNPGDVSFLAGKRILLVDDVDINRIIVVDQLAEMGLHIDEAGDGQEAVDMFTASPPNHYDLIFMDVQMPRMDGYEATRTLRALDREDARRVPIVAMTANAFKEDVEKALGSGMNAHLAKPLEHEKMMEVLAVYLAGRSA